MIDHYDAFISYKHAALDSRIAEHVQRNLEFFYIPHKIRKSTGKKRISRIFRDKSELANTSDLSDTIANALEKSDYLIVICSPNTKQSIWVNREIEYFLRNHTKKQILTVIAGGEPVEVIPDELKHDVRKIAGDDGQFYEVDAPTEPLSCDYRMPLNKAKNEELPRLAATIIGCSYDELVRRQRAYRMKRALAIGSLLIAAAIAFGGYMFYSKKKVDAALRQALENRSVSLANSADKLLDDKDRISALFLAREAIPKNGNADYPVTPEAFHALSDAVLAYQGLDGLNINHTWNYSFNNQVKDFVLNEDGSRLAVLSSDETVSLWNTEDHSKIIDFKDPEHSSRKVSFPVNDALIVCSIKTIRAFDAADGKEIWKIESDTPLTYDDPVPGEEGYIYVSLRKNELWKIDIKTGEISGKYDIDITLEEEDKNLSYDELKMSPDKTKIAFKAYAGIYEYYVVTYDLKSGKKVLRDASELSVDDIEWNGEDRIITVEHKMSLGAEGSTKLNDKTHLSPYSVFVKCYDASTLKEVWSKEQVCVGVYESIGLVMLEAQDMVAAYAGNKCCAYDINSGELVYDWDTNETIIEANDRDGDGIPMMFTKDGAYTNPSVSSGNKALSLYYCLPRNLRKVAVNKGIYLVKQNGRDISYFTTYVRDEDWQQVEDFVTTSLSNRLVADNVVAFISAKEDLPVLALIDTADNSLIREVKLCDDQYSAYEYKILFADGENVYLLRRSKGLHFITVPIRSGDPEEEFISGEYEYGVSEGSYSDGKIAYLVNTFDQHLCCLYDVAGGKTEKYELNDIEDHNSFDSAIYCKDLNAVYLPGKKEKDRIVDLKTGSLVSVSLPEDWEYTDLVCIDKERSQLILSDKNKIVYVSTDGKILLSISCEGKIPAGLSVVKDPGTGKDLLLVSYSDGVLSRYDITTGDIIASSRISYYSDQTPDARFEVDEKAGLLYVSMGYVIDIVDLNSWKELTYINCALGRCKSLDRFYTFSYVRSTELNIGYYKHYTLQDLIDKADKILEDEPVPEVLRAEYGLNDIIR